MEHVMELDQKSLQLKPSIIHDDVCGCFVLQPAGLELFAFVIIALKTALRSDRLASASRQRSRTDRKEFLLNSLQRLPVGCGADHEALGLNCWENGSGRVSSSFVPAGGGGGGGESG